MPGGRNRNMTNHTIRMGKTESDPISLDTELA